MLHGCDRVVAIVGVLVVSLVCAASASAADRTWTGDSGVDSSWHTATNWEPEVVPTAADDVVIATGTPTITTGDADVGRLTLSVDVHISGGRTLTIHGAGPPSTWSAGTISIFDSGTVVNAGQLSITGSVAMAASGPGPHRFHNLGVVESSGAAVGMQIEIENDGTLDVTSGSLVQSGSVASPPESSGAFVAGSGAVLSLSNVLMGSASTAGGTGTLRFDGGTSTVAAGADYQAGITTLGGSGALVFNDDGTTDALRFDGFATRAGTGTLTVGGGQSRLGDFATFTDTGRTEFTASSQVAIDGPVWLTAPVGAHTLRLHGTTSWTAGDISIFDAGTIENAGQLNVTGTVNLQAASGLGPHRFHNLAGGTVNSTAANVGFATEIENDGTLAVTSGSLVQSGSVLTPAESSGTFAPQGTGVLSLSNVLIGPASTAAGTGTLRFAGGTSTVAAGANYQAGITALGGSGTLVFNDDGTTDALRFDGFATRAGTGTLTVDDGQSRLGDFATFTDAGVTAFSAASQVEIDGPVWLTAPAGAHTLRLDGTTTWAGGDISIFDAGTVENAGQLNITGTVNLQAASGLGPHRFHNLAGGTVNSSAPNVGFATEIENDGTLTVTSGSLVQSGPVATPAESSGTFAPQGSGVLSLSNVLMGPASTATGTGTLRFAGGTSTVAAGANYQAGVTTLGGSGTLIFNDDGSTEALRFDGFATRGGTGTLTVDDGQSRLGDFASFTDAGVTAFSAASQVEIDGPVWLTAPAGAHTLRLDGTTTWAGGDISIFDAGTVENAGQLNITGNVNLQAASGPGPHRFHNLAGGTVDSSAPNVGFATEIENDGMLAVTSGSLMQSGSALTPAESSGTFAPQGPGVLSLSNVLMGPGSGASGTGTLRFAGGTSTVAAGANYQAGITALGGSGTLVFNDDGSTGALRFDGFATRGGTGTLTVDDGQSRIGDFASFTDAGRTEFTPGSQLLIDGPVWLTAPAGAHTLRLDGTTTWAGGDIFIFDAGTVENAGQLTITGDASLQAGSGGPHVFNSLAGAAFTVGAGGTFTVSSGVMVDADSPIGLNGGTLAGNGTVQGTVANAAGTVSPSSSLTITEDYTQGAGGKLRAEIAGVGAHDSLQVGGTATLGGTLELVTLGGFDPAPSDTFRVLDAGSRTGAFATVTGAQATASKRYQPSYDLTGVTLAIGLGPANTAAPSIPASGRAGDAVTCDPGSWTGSPAFSFSWLRDGAPIAAGQTYTLTAADAGRTIVCRVTATNANGTANATSNALVPSSPQPDQPQPDQPPPPPPPETGETFNAEAERGKVTVRLPDGRTVVLDETVQIETGSVVDTREGAVRLFAEGRGGDIDSGVFSDGLFRVTQSKGSRPVTELRLVEKLTGCPKRGKASTAARRRRKKRRLWGDATGDFRTRGEYGNGINDGTKWLTEDRCDGTLFRVQRGVVAVRRNGQGKVLRRVKAGQSYLVRRRP